MPIFNEKLRKKYSKTYKRKRKQFRNESRKKSVEREFICFDGETLNDKYVLLGNSENHVYKSDGLTTIECLNFLYYEGKGCLKIIFAIHFDIQHWIKDLSDENIIGLLNGENVIYEDYELRYITKRFLSISKNKKRVYIYDISSFFQTSLLNTIEQMQLNLSIKEKNILEKGKSLRGDNFRSMQLKQVIEYNRIECVVTERIADKLRNILLNTVLKSNERTFNLFPTRFYGSGAIAKKVLKNLEFENYSIIEKRLDNKIKKFIYNSYFGGRAEVFRIGTFHDIYKYDINSAYPFAMTQLKKINGYQIKKINKTYYNYEFADFNIYHLEIDLSLCDSKLIGILPFRRKDGYIIFPKRLKGYYFGCECKWLNELIKKNGLGSYKIFEVLEINYSKQLLFEKGFIEEIYLKRLELKKNNDLSQIAYKLALNSLYGKLAQQTGLAEFSIINYASLITSITRSKILEAIFENNAFNSVIQISTDGIFVKKKFNNINTGENLGQWTEEKYRKGIILGSGVYGLYDKKEVFALRGLAVSKENFESIYKVLLKKRSASITYSAFVGHKLALAQKEVHGKHRLKFTEITKQLKPFEYEKRLFLEKNEITKESFGYWFDYFENEKVVESAPLKKFDLDLIEESLQIAYR